MKQNKVKQNDHRGTIFCIAAAVLLLVLAGIAAGYIKLRNVWLEQCVIKDSTTQISITSGKMVKADVLAAELGLKPGANLALIDFEAKRKRTLEKIPNLRSISISRELPDKITVVAEERLPVARMNVHGSKAETGRVVDTEGVVFVWQRDTQTLPVLREAHAPGTSVGSRLTGRSLAALRLIEASLDQQFADLGFIEVDTYKPDFIVATRTNYSRVKIAWDSMDAPSPVAHASLMRQLTLLVKAIRTRVGENAPVWNATDTSTPGKIFVDFKGGL